ncbi:unnamed protein product [Sphagnum balticum]
MKDSEQDKMLNPNHQRLGLQVTLKGAMEQLQVLAQNAQGSDKKVMEQAEAMVKNNEAWEAERSSLLEKVAASETQSLRTERESIKDTEADAKAVGTVSNHEQGWKDERVKLHTEIHGLQDEIAKIWHHSEIRATDSGSFCEDCIVKGSLLKELAGKLSTAEIDASELRKKLATVISNSMKHLAAVADATAKHEEMENKLVNATKEMEVMRRDLESAASAKRTQNTIIEELLSDVMTIQKDLIEKEEILAVTLTRASIDREEKHNLEKELVYAKRKRKAVEVEKDRWKRLAEERRHTSSSGKDTDNRLRGMVKSKQEVAKRSELQRMHTQELQSVQSLYTEKLKALEHQLKTYENKVGLLESKVLVCSRQRKVGRHLLKEDEVPDMLNLKQTVNVHELVMLLESLEPDVSTIRTDGQTSEIQELPMTKHGLKEWLKGWLEAVKAQAVVQIEEQHHHELDSLKIQMNMKDEKLDSFRHQLLSLESETSKMKSDIEMLNSPLTVAVNIKQRVEKTAEEKDDESVMDSGGMERDTCHEAREQMADHHVAQQKVIRLLQAELAMTKRALKDAEAELQQKDCQITLVEAEVSQLKRQIDTERATDQETVTDMGYEEWVVNRSFKDTVVGAQETDVKNAISSACTEVAKLANKIAEVRKIMMEAEDQFTDNGIGLGLVDQAKDGQSSSRQLFKLSVNKLASEFRTEILTDEVLTTGVLEEAEWVEEGASSLPTLVQVVPPNDHNTQPVVPSMETEIRYVTVDTENTLEELEEGTTTEKRRRKTLIEYFLDSPPDLVVENACMIPDLHEGVHGDGEDVNNPDHGIVQVLEKNTLVENQGPLLPTSCSDGAMQLNPYITTESLSPLFARMKAKRTESSRTMEDIEVLGLALEVRKVEEQLDQIGNKGKKEEDSTAGIPLPKALVSKKSTKCCATLSSRVGQLAKQMDLTSSEHVPDMITENHLNGPSTSELLNFQKRVDALSCNLATIEAKSSQENLAGATLQDSGVLKENLLQSVRAHLTQLQWTISSKMAPACIKHEDR